MNKSKSLLLALASGTFLLTISFLGLRQERTAGQTLKSPLGEIPGKAEVTSSRIITDTGSTPSTFKRIMGRVLGFENQAKDHKRLTHEVFGFLPFWTLDKRVFFRYELLSTIAYFGLDIDGQGNFIKIRDNGKSDGAWDNWKSPELTEVIQEAHRHGVRVLLTVKGFDDGTIEALLACAACRRNLIASALREVQDRQIEGVNVDFEYVSEPDDNLVFRFTQFINDLGEAFHEKIPGSYVSISTYVKSATEKKIHDVKNLAKVADSLFIMGYDFFRPASNYAGPTSPLGGAEKYGYDLTTAVADYLKIAPPEKLILGLPYYGYDWPVENNQANAKVLTGSNENGSPNMSSYVKSQYDSRNTDKSRRWDADTQVPFYSWFDEEHKVWRQCYYENVKSLSLKYDLIKEKGLRGVGIWALGYDGSYPELWDLLQEKFTQP